jgi:hypothetical protein
MCFKIQGEFGPSMVSRKAAGDNRLGRFEYRALEPSRRPRLVGLGGPARLDRLSGKSGKGNDRRRPEIGRAEAGKFFAVA